MTKDLKWFDHKDITLNFSDCFDYSFYYKKIIPKNWKFLPKNWIKVKDISDFYTYWEITNWTRKYYENLLKSWYIKNASFDPDFKAYYNADLYNEEEFYEELHLWQRPSYPFNTAIIVVWVCPPDSLNHWRSFSNIKLDGSFLELENIIKAHEKVLSYWYIPATIELNIMSIKWFNKHGTYKEPNVLVKKTDFDEYSKEDRQEFLQIHKKHIERLIWLCKQDLNTKLVFSQFCEEWGRIHALEIPKKYSLWFLNMMLEGDTREI